MKTLKHLAGEVAENIFIKVMEKMQRVCDAWFNISLTIGGKVMVVNSFILSFFVLRLSQLLQVYGSQIKMINSLIHRCLQTGKKQ